MILLLFFHGFQIACTQEHKRNPEIHLWLLIWLCEPKIFSGPVWTAVLKKNSGSANEHRLFLCTTMAHYFFKMFMLNGFKQDIKNLKTVKNYTKLPASA